MARTTNLWRMIRQLTTEEQLKKVIEAVEARRPFGRNIALHLRSDG